MNFKLGKGIIARGNRAVMCQLRCFNDERGMGWLLRGAIVDQQNVYVMHAWNPEGISVVGPQFDLIEQLEIRDQETAIQA